MDYDFGTSRDHLSVPVIVYLPFSYAAVACPTAISLNMSAITASSIKCFLHALKICQEAHFYKCHYYWELRLIWQICWHQKLCAMEKIGSQQVYYDKLSMTEVELVCIGNNLKMLPVPKRPTFVFEKLGGTWSLDPYIQ